MSVNGSEKKLTMGTPFKPEKNKWMHVAVTYESESRKIQIYVNGKPMLLRSYNFASREFSCGRGKLHQVKTRALLRE